MPTNKSVARCPESLRNRLPGICRFQRGPDVSVEDDQRAVTLTCGRNIIVSSRAPEFGEAQWCVLEGEVERGMRTVILVLWTDAEREGCQCLSPGCVQWVLSQNKEEGEAGPSPVDTEGPTDQCRAFFSSP